MKFNSFIFTQIVLTSSLVASGAVSVDAKEATQPNSTQENQGISRVEEAQYDADLHLDTLDADGHLSILEAETYIAKSYEQEVKAEPQIAVTKLNKSTSESNYLEATYLPTKAAHSSESFKIAAAPKAEVDSHGEDHGASNAHEGDHGASKSGSSFLTKHTTEIEFTFAILVIVVGLIASERFQRVQEQQMQVTNESLQTDFGAIEEG